MEYLLLLLSARIREETGNEELAAAAESLASASHGYLPQISPEPLVPMGDDWRTKFGDLMFNKRLMTK